MSDFGPCTHDEALAEIDRLDKENARLRAALEKIGIGLSVLPSYEIARAALEETK